MARRRFVPKLDGLEHRQLLSTASPAANDPPPAATTAAFSTTADQSAVEGQLGRERRIQNLPGLLAQVNSDRVVPRDLISALQDNLRSIQNTLHRPSSNIVSAFNRALRDTIPHATLGIANAARLNSLFGQVLNSAGAPEEIVVAFQANMNALAKLDSFSTLPAITGANDYALLAQLSMGIGLTRRGT